MRRVLVLAVLIISLGACTKLNPKYCSGVDDCCPKDGGSACELMCSSTHACVPMDAGIPIDSMKNNDAMTEGGSTTDAEVKSDANDAGSPPDALVDQPTPPPQCTSSSACSGTIKPICSNGMCVGCVNDADCKALGDKLPICAATGACVQCSNDTHCAGQTGTPYCSAANQCVGCVALGTGACRTKNAQASVCNNDSGVCVQCVANSDCSGTTPYCSAGKCMGCGAAPVNPNLCKSISATTPVCAATGACVECAKGADCPTTSPQTPLCNAAGTCVSCSARDATESCAVAYSVRPACATSGACVECVTNGDCKNPKPVCDTSKNQCAPCASDAQCAGKPGPGVCATDGHCATEAETIYVQQTGGPACDDAGTGTSAKPLCTMQPVQALLGQTRFVAIVRGTVTGASWTYKNNVTNGTFMVVAQSGQSGTIASTVAPGFAMQSGSVLMRGIKISPSASVGISATGGTLRLDNVTVDSCMGGGILLDGAAFDIENTTVTGNGPGTFGLATWGGIFINNPPTGMPKTLSSVTVQDNKSTGVTCSVPIVTMTTLVTNNAALDVHPTCNFSSCIMGTANCGAQ